MSALQRRRRLRGPVVAGIVAVLLMAFSPVSAGAEDPPPNPSDQQIEDAQAAKDAQAAEVGRLSGLVAAADGEIESLQIDVENASSAYIAAEGALEQARIKAEQTRAAVVEAAAAVDEATADLALFARNSYIQGSTLDNSFVLLDSNGPAELIERAGLLEALSHSHLDVISEVEIARVQKANADSAERSAVLEREAAERAAAEALEVAESTLDSAQARLVALQQEKAQFEVQLQEAQQALLGVEGARQAYEEYQARKAAEEAELQRQREEAARAAAEAAARAAAAAEEARNNAQPPPPPPPGGGGGGGGGSSPPPAPPPSGDWVLPAIGTTTSCYGARWGSFHYGVDIAAPMYDPIYAVGDGTVVRAGYASGFGQAVYIEHANGDVTVYGHEEVIKVSTGQRVYAGQVIALIGTQGFSTGPHVHFEVQLGLYGTRVDPADWLLDRGVDVPGC
ncbi:MAG: M23 family metallopeptidase [Geodermatophilaceae bacterium]